MTSQKVFENIKNNEINLQLKHNLITLNKMMLNMWTEQIIDLGYKES